MGRASCRPGHRTGRPPASAGRAWAGVAAGVAGLCLGFNTDAARIAEPGTVLFGKITEKVGTLNTPVTAGTLVWRIKTVGIGGREQQLTTTVAPFGSAPSGPYAYRLTLPHELLAYDLSVRSSAVPLGAASAKVQYVSVTLNGKALTIAPLVATGFSVDQTRRAGTQQVDLTLQVVGQDSDGDGFPDDWEDANGYDKWDPTDAPTGNTGGGGGSTAASQARSFAEWRSAWYPGLTGDLEAFGNLDSDGDGIVNLLEYAFDLNPTKAEPVAAAAALPQSYSEDGRQGLAFRRHAQATDLVFEVEHAPDLVTWSDALELLEARPNTVAGDTRALLVEKASESDHDLRFFRVVVRRQ